MSRTTTADATAPDALSNRLAVDAELDRLEALLLGHAAASRELVDASEHLARAARSSREMPAVSPTGVPASGGVGSTRLGREDTPVTGMRRVGPAAAAAAAAASLPHASPPAPAAVSSDLTARFAAFRGEKR